jgi:ENTS family enterobactin (siderophore) exporter
MWATSVLLAAQAWADLGSVGLLYALVAAQAAAYAVNNAARAAIVPRLVRRELLPAANALTTASMTLGAVIGPALGGVLVAAGGFGVAYTVDVVMYLASLWAIWRLPRLRPQGQVARPGLRSVAEGLRFLAGRPAVRMTFLVDLSAMVLALPRALFPAIGALVLGGGAAVAGLLASAVAVGSLLATVVSGRLGSVRRQGAAVALCVVGWGLAVAVFGVVLLVADRPDAAASAPGGGVGLTGASAWLWPAAACLMLAGAADAVSSVFRTTILQDATPDAMRGRLQGVFIVVVAGGPRLGDLVSGSLGDLVGVGLAPVVGGLACVLTVVLLVRRNRAFLHYDARHPRP